MNPMMWPERAQNRNRSIGASKPVRRSCRFAMVGAHRVIGQHKVVPDDAVTNLVADRRSLPVSVHR